MHAASYCGTAALSNTSWSMLAEQFENYRLNPRMFRAASRKSWLCTHHRVYRPFLSTIFHTANGILKAKIVSRCLCIIKQAQTYLEMLCDSFNSRNSAGDRWRELSPTATYSHSIPLLHIVKIILLFTWQSTALFHFNSKKRKKNFSIHRRRWQRIYSRHI